MRALSILCLCPVLILTGCSASSSSVPVRAQAATFSFNDSAEDGIPDFLRLDSEADRQSFRNWLTFLAEVQYFTPSNRRPSEITDCSALLRYCYREALRQHDSAWSSESKLHYIPALSSVRKYNYPRTPLKANLFRIQPGAFVPADLDRGAFAQFADADKLCHFNTFFVGRDIGQALPGDLLFFRKAGSNVVWHSMIFVGRSQIAPDQSSYVVYSTGENGVMKRLTLRDLGAFPDPKWRPNAENSLFLGVFRWNILHKTT